MPTFEIPITLYVEAINKDDASNLIEEVLAHMLDAHPEVLDTEVDFADVALDYSTENSSLNYDEDEESTVLNTGATRYSPLYNPEED